MRKCPVHPSGSKKGRHAQSQFCQNHVWNQRGSPEGRGATRGSPSVEQRFVFRSGLSARVVSPGVAYTLPKTLDRRSLGLRMQVSLRMIFILESLACLHHEFHVLQFMNAQQWVTRQRDDIRIGPGNDHTQFALVPQHFRRA